MDEKPITRDQSLIPEKAFFERVKPRLIDEGHELEWLLVKGEEVVGIWPTYPEAAAVWKERFPRQVLLLRQLVSVDAPYACGYNKRCFSSVF